MSAADLIIRSRRVVTPQGILPACIHIRDGRISAVTSFDKAPADSKACDAGDSVVMPGLVDTHVHINEPGRTDWEGFETATRAAAAGGITTLVDMPLNSIPPTTSVAAFEEKLAASARKLWVDVGFWGGLVPANAAYLRPLLEAGVFGFKCFLIPSGVPEFQHVTEADLRAALPTLAELGAPLLVHAELLRPIHQAAHAFAVRAPTVYSSWLAARPRTAENEAVALLIRLCREYGARIHIVHLSSSDALPAIRRAKDEGLSLTVETCPHYLAFSAEEIRDGATEFKCAPPIRERENREKLWSALADGLIDLVATDHSPSPQEMKCRPTGDFLRAWGGISSLQLSLPVMWTELRARGRGLEHLVKWMCGGPASLAGLERRKGTIQVGYDADLLMWDPDRSFRVEPERLGHRHKLTPYAGRDLFGIVETTWIRGKIAYACGGFPSGPIGRALQRGRP